MSYRTAVAKTLPSVVTVHAARADAAGRGSASVTLGLATGVILERDGFIVTASQVVAEANQLAVALRDGTVLPARLVASHPDSGVALVKVDAEGLQPIESAIRATWRSAMWCWRSEIRWAWARR